MLIKIIFVATFIVALFTSIFFRNFLATFLFHLYHIYETEKVAKSFFFLNVKVSFFQRSSKGIKTVVFFSTTHSRNRQNGKTSKKKFISLFLDFGHLKCPKSEKLNQIFFKLVLRFCRFLSVYFSAFF